ncbi:MAG: polyisoprenoid-binding protein [Bacteroidetes bacterium]|nr:polyisoprenoid-binding protein [Bacteroidota bacterium]
MEHQTKWVLDPLHSELVFRVKHLMITSIRGEFRKFNIELCSRGSDFSDASMNAVIEADSVFTNNDERDGHLRSADFFDAQNFKQLKFKGTSFEKLDDENYKLNGLLTIKGISKEVFLEVEFGGIKTDPDGNEKAGFSVAGKINRKDWGLSWNAALQAGGVLVSDDVKMNAEMQFIKLA